MPSPKLVNRITLCCCACFFSLGLGLLVNRNFTSALLGGVVAFPASYLASVIADKQRHHQEKRLRGSLNKRIQEMRLQYEQLCQSLSTTKTSQQQVEAHIQALNNECRLLKERVSELHLHRNELRKEIGNLTKQAQEKKVANQAVNKPLQKVAPSPQPRVIDSTQVIQQENKLKSLQYEIKQLKEQIFSQKYANQQIKQELTTLEAQKKELESSYIELKQQIESGEKQQTELQTSLLSLQIRKQDLKNNIVDQEAKLAELELSNSEQEQPPRTTVSDEAGEHIMSLILPEEWLEWLDFIQQLDEQQKVLLKIIIEQDELALKDIADQQATMPEVLIDAVNESALNIFGDLIFVRKNDSVMPEIYAEYAAIIHESTTVYFQDLLD